MPRISTLPLNDRAAAKDELPAVDVAEQTTKKLTVDMIMPTGAIIDYAGGTAPEGWLLCYGQSLNATANPKYAELFAAIGTTYGGTGITAFNVPDLRGRVAAGADDMGGTAANRLTTVSLGVAAVRGAVGGAQTHTLTEAQIPAHQHLIGYRDYGAGKPTYQPDSSWTTMLINAAYFGYGSNNTSSFPTGGGGAHNNVQPTIIMNKIIKY